MNSTIIAIIAGVVISGTIYSVYASLIKKKNKVEEAFSSIDVQLKKRYDLIPNILTIASKFMEHEKGVFEKITELRTQALSMPKDVDALGKKLELDSQIKDLMKGIMVSVENYPELKSDTTMVTAMQTYNEVEEHISAARRFYNSAVNDLNNAVEIFPSSMFAAMLGISKKEFFKIESYEREKINAGDYLK